jgi:hypothetical protein
LVDVSETYTDQKAQVADLIKKGILPELLPGDTVVLIRIDSSSYAQENVVARLTLDDRPSHANAQKLDFARQLDAFVLEDDGARHTDIQGAFMLAAEYLRETRAGTQTIVAFSDMKEELPRGVHRTLDANELADIRVVAVNVKKLDGDNQNPAVYRGRLHTWEQLVLSSGAREWHVIVDGPKLVDYLRQRA